jgi:uncharacterized HAD superfamily protein
MKTKIIAKIDVSLLEKEYKIRCYIEVEKAIVVHTYMNELDIENFKSEFYAKYLLEYGDLKLNFINEEYNKYIMKIEDFISKEVAIEKKRIEKLLEHLNKDTLNFLKNSENLNPKRKV